MPYPASIFERQRQLSTSLSTSTPSQSKMMRSGWVIAGFPSRSEHILRKWAITHTKGDFKGPRRSEPVATADEARCGPEDRRCDSVGAASAPVSAVPLLQAYESIPMETFRQHFV